MDVRKNTIGMFSELPWLSAGLVLDGVLEDFYRVVFRSWALWSRV